MGKPQTILPNTIPHNHTHITPTLGTLDTALPKRNNTHNIRPQTTRQLDTTADLGTPYNVAHTQPTPPTMMRRMQKMQTAHDTWLKNAQMHSNILPKHYIHIIRAHMHKYILQGPAPGGQLFTKAHIATPLAAQGPLRDARSDKIIEEIQCQTGGT